MELYYFEGNIRRGPVNPAQLKALVLRGLVTRETIIEADGKQIPASKVKGLEFPTTAVPPVAPPPIPPVADPILTEPEPVFLNPDPAPLREEKEDSDAKPATTSPDKFFLNFRRKCNAVDLSGVILATFGLIQILIGICSLIVTENEAPIGIGIFGSGVGFIISAQIFFWLGALGRFLLSRDKNEKPNPHMKGQGNVLTTDIFGKK